MATAAFALGELAQVHEGHRIEAGAGTSRPAHAPVG